MLHGVNRCLWKGALLPSLLCEPRSDSFQPRLGILQERWDVGCLWHLSCYAPSPVRRMEGPPNPSPALLFAKRWIKYK